MAGDLIGPMEARLLALERRQARLDEDLRGLKIGAIGAGQQIWDAWPESFGTGGAGEETLPCIDFSPTCACVPETLFLTDSYYGIEIPIAYQPASQSWRGCAQVTTPARPPFCSSVSSGLNYFFQGFVLTANWSAAITIGRTPGFCAEPRLCSDPLGAVIAINNSNATMTAAITCTPFFWTRTFTCPFTADVIYGGGTVVTLTVHA